jgi:hypothetical protein
MVLETTISGSAENATLLAKGATADVYAWGEGRVLKLFTERTPWHANEISATRAAHKAHLPVPGYRSGCRSRVPKSLSSLRIDRLRHLRDRRLSPGGF